MASCQRDESSFTQTPSHTVMGAVACHGVGADYRWPILAEGCVAWLNDFVTSYRRAPRDQYSRTADCPPWSDITEFPAYLLDAHKKIPVL